MDLCSNGHDEVAYEGRDCPMCELREELEDEHADHVDDMQDEIEKRNNIIADLEFRIEELEGED